MTRKASRVLLAWLLATTVTGVTAAQNAVTWTGTWDVRIVHMSGRVVVEQWIVEQNGNKVTGTVKLPNGREFPLEGPVDGNTIDWKVTTRTAAEEGGERYHNFIGTRKGGSITGTLERPNNDDEGTFVAKRASS